MIVPCHQVVFVCYLSYICSVDLGLCFQVFWKMMYDDAVLIYIFFICVCAYIT